MRQDSGLLRRLYEPMLVLLILLLLGFAVNASIHIRGLYMDDLYMWSCYGEQSFTEFVFPVGTSSRFRPVYWAAAYLQMMLIQQHVGWLVPLNIILNAGIAWYIYFFARRLSEQPLFSLLCGGLYLLSHFAYYQIAQALGLLESLALFLALCLLWLLYELICQPQHFCRFYLALCVYVLLVLTHERYLALLPLFFVALWAHGSRRIENWGLPFLCFALVFGIRRYTIGAALPAGTGGTQVTDTFSLKQALGFCVQQLQYIFGMNVGPEYLSGISWEQAADWVHRLVYLSWLPLGVIFAAFLLHLLFDGWWREARFWQLNLLFVGFIALCIGCSSVTIRLEMRWIYVSYAASLLYLSYMLGCIGERWSGGRRRLICGLLTLCLALYAACMTPVELYERKAYPQLYFWENQDRMNSLADETVGRYGVDAVLGKQVYILENRYEMSDFYARTFFKVYDPGRTGRGTEIHFIASLRELPANAGRDNALVLKEAPQKRGYQDITNEVFP